MITSTYIIQSKSAAGPTQVNVYFQEYLPQPEAVADGTPPPPPAATPQNFNRTFDQADANQFEINSLWTVTIAPAG